MVTRLLPTTEWHRLQGSEVGKALPYHNRDDVQIIVVEDEGQIVAMWAVLKVVQLEGVWIAPAYRKRGTVAKRLLDRTMAVARAKAPYFAFTGSQSADVSQLLEKHLHAVKMPMDQYVIPLREVPCR